MTPSNIYKAFYRYFSILFDPKTSRKGRSRMDIIIPLEVIRLDSEISDLSKVTQLAIIKDN